MAGVEVVMQGRCSNRKVQDELAVRLNKIWKAQNDQEGWREVSFTGEVLYEDVILAGTLFEGEKLPHHLRRLAENAFLAEEVRLFGGVMSLTGDKAIPERDWKIGIDEVPLSFIRSSDPKLDGRLVLPQDINPQHPFSAVGRVLLDNPSFGISNDAQDWVKEMLIWVKRNYLHHLRCWVNCRLLPSEWPKESALTESLEVETQFEALLKSYEARIEGWSKRIEGIGEAVSLSL
jgi:hypothetical protein